MNINSILLFYMILQCKTYFSQADVVGATRKAQQTLSVFLSMFFGCVKEPVTNMHFEIDDIKKFIIFPPKTTVGFAPRYTSNRKFFANLISTPAFQEMLDADKKKLGESFVKKLEYCDKSVMDPVLLNDFYDREVDQNRM